jgi:hypothetical protein
MKYYSAGFTSIIKSKSKYGKKFAMTASACINNIFPNDWAVPYCGISECEKSIIMEYLKTDIFMIHKEIESNIESNKFGLPNIFMNYNDMNKFNKNHCKKNDDLIEVGLSIPEIELEKIIEDLAETTRTINDVGLYKSLQNRRETTAQESYGFDIIGLEVDGSFHSFHCHDLENHFLTNFNITLNNHGLIKTLEECLKIVAWINTEESGCEPVNWYICRVDYAKIT